MAAYYNDNDKFVCAWLRELIKAGVIADGEVDERSITEVSAADVAGFTQCHFFAGIGGWSAALRLAGWPDTRTVWTGSCPCQPWSAAGKGTGAADPRDLWPAWCRLLCERRPAVVFGEQVASVDGLAWLDRVSADMEAADYAVGAVDLCAPIVGAFHIRQRLYFVARTNRLADHDGEGRGEFGAPWLHERWASSRGDRADARDGDRPCGDDAARRSALGELADDNGSRCGARWPSEARDEGDTARIEPAGLRNARALADAEYAERWPLFLPGDDERDGRDARWTETHGEPRARRALCDMADAARGGLGIDGRASGRSGHADECDPSRIMADAVCERGQQERRGAPGDEGSHGRESHGDHLAAGHGADRRELGDADDARSQGRGVSAERPGESLAGSTGLASVWDDVEWIPCSDGKARPIKSGTFPLAYGTFARVGRLRGYGNCIVPQVAAKFIGAYLDISGGPVA